MIAPKLISPEPDGKADLYRMAGPIEGLFHFSCPDSACGLEGREDITLAEWSPLADIIEDDKEYVIKSFRLPDDADADKVKAEFKDGILTVRLAKNEKAQPKQIEVAVA